MVIRLYECAYNRFSRDLTYSKSENKTIMIYKTMCFIILAFPSESFRLGECGCLVVNASDSVSRGQRFEPHWGQTVLCP